jgi:EAL domain-containing protein (putative c-di-GMP-specific phosphodiesterase class I)
MRPEERMDSAVGMLSWASYRSDIRKIALSGEHVRIVVIRLLNCLEIRNFVGDHNYNQYLSEVADRIRAVRWTHRHRIEIYFERPGTIYLITDADESGSEDAGERLLAEVGDLIRGHVKMGVCFEPRVCLIRCPEDLQKAEDVISLGHIFLQIDERKQTVFRASEIVHSRTFAMQAHIEQIFDRALKNHNIKMFYQPILDVQSGRFRSAEALARIIDPEYGLISPAVFIPAAETEGYIIPIGDAVLDQVFRFVSEHDLDALGLSCVEINLSVAQCMERSLPEKISALQKKYGVDPGKINLEITETAASYAQNVMMNNLEKLTQAGISFSLDDYGTGYSNIKSVASLPISIVKLDKTFVDEEDNPRMWIVLKNTIKMLKDMDMSIVVEGVENAELAKKFADLNCEYIQGYYYSKPVPKSDFITFMKNSAS